MLHHLRVVNLGVIADTALDFAPGLNVITGETGTGKTLLLGGLRLLLGDKADGSLVGGGEGEARVEGLFGHGDDEVAVVRTVPAGGKSRRSEEHTSELQSRPHLVCRLLLEKKKT